MLVDGRWLQALVLSSVSSRHRGRLTLRASPSTTTAKAATTPSSTTTVATTMDRAEAVRAAIAITLEAQRLAGECRRALTLTLISVCGHTPFTRGDAHRDTSDDRAGRLASSSHRAVYSDISVNCYITASQLGQAARDCTAFLARRTGPRPVRHGPCHGTRPLLTSVHVPNLQDRVSRTS